MEMGRGHSVRNRSEPRCAGWEQGEGLTPWWERTGWAGQVTQEKDLKGRCRNGCSGWRGREGGSHLRRGFLQGEWVREQTERHPRASGTTGSTVKMRGSSRKGTDLGCWDRKK